MHTLINSGRGCLSLLWDTLSCLQEKLLNDIYYLSAKTPSPTAWAVAEVPTLAVASKHGWKKKICPSGAWNHYCSCRKTLHTQHEVGLQPPVLTALGRVGLRPGHLALLVMVTEPTTELSISHFLSEEPCEHISVLLIQFCYLWLVLTETLGAQL